MSEELVSAAFRGDLKKVQEILGESGIVVNYQSDDVTVEGRIVDALAAAVGNNHISVANFLMEKGANNFLLALEIAAITGRIHLMNIFLAKLPNILNDKDQSTAGGSLINAAGAGQVEAVICLLSDPHKRFDVNYMSDDGYTPLIDAIEEDQVDVVRYLVVEAGASLDPASSEDRDPLEVATQHGNREIISIIEQAKKKRGPAAETITSGGATASAADAGTAAPGALVPDAGAGSAGGGSAAANTWAERLAQQRGTVPGKQGVVRGRGEETAEGAGKRLRPSSPVDHPGGL